MAAGALTLGVSHPPGYPLYILVTHLWLKFLPWGSVAFRLNVFSAAAGALGCCVLAGAVRKGDEESAGGFAGPLLAFAVLAFAPAYWHLSVVSEMYSANALVGAALLALMLPTSNPMAHRRRIYAGALLFGLGLGNHQTLVAVLPGFLWIARGELWGGQGFWAGRFWRERVPALLFFSLVGFLLYAYLPLRSSADPILNWGEPQTLRNFLRMLTRADYGGVRLVPDRPFGLISLSAWGTGLKYTVRLMIGEFGGPGVLLLAWGAIVGRRHSFTQGCLVSFFLSGPLFIVWANLDPAAAPTYAIIEPHLVLPLVFAAAVAGVGARDLFARAAALSPRLASAGLAIIIAGGWMVTMASKVSAQLSHRNDYSAWDYGKSMHAAMAPGSLLLDPDDPTAFTLSYMTIAHNMRPDIIPLLYFRTRWGYEQLKRRHPELLPDWEIQSGQALLGILVSRSLKAGRNVFVDLPQKTPIGTASYPAGLLYKLFEKPPEIDDRLSLYYRAERARHVVRFRAASLDAGFFTRHTIEYWSSSLNNLGIEAQAFGWPDKAIELYRRALVVSPHLAEAWNNMGNAVLEMGDAAAAEGCYRLSLRLKPKAEIMYNLGRVFLLQSRHVDAELEFRRSIDAGGPREARNDLGLVLLRTGRLKEASRIWLTLLDEDPYYLLAYYNLGLVFEKMGRNDDAYKAVSTYAQLVADPRERRAARAWLARLKI